MFRNEFQLTIASRDFELRSSIVEAANRAVVGKSFDQLRVNEICSEAGISKQTFYRYFSNKVDVAIWAGTMVVCKYFAEIGKTLTWLQVITGIMQILRETSVSNLSIRVVHSSRRTEFFDGVTSAICEEMVRHLEDVRNVAVNDDLAYQIKVFVYALVTAVEESATHSIPSEVMAGRVLKVLPRDIEEAFH